MDLLELRARNPPRNHNQRREKGIPLMTTIGRGYLRLVPCKLHGNHHSLGRMGCAGCSGVIQSLVAARRRGQLLTL